MPIRAQCPNPSCRQTLEVPDQYAGSQGKCPTCGTMVTFQAGSPGAPAPMPPPAAPPPAGAYAPPSAPPPSDAPVGMYPPSAAPAGPPMDPAKLVEMICPPAGLFFLALILLACFLPWAYTLDFFHLPLTGPVNMNGFSLREAGIFFVLCLIVTALSGLIYLYRQLLPLAAVVGAGFGSFAVLYFVASMIKVGNYYGGAKAGIIVGLIAAIGVAGALITLSLFRPYEPPLTQSLGSPLMKRHGALFGAIAAGVALGFVYLVVTALA